MEILAAKMTVLVIVSAVFSCPEAAFDILNQPIRSENDPACIRIPWEPD